MSDSQKELCSSDLDIYVFPPIRWLENFDLEERINPDKLKSKKRHHSK